MSHEEFRRAMRIDQDCCGLIFGNTCRWCRYDPWNLTYMQRLVEIAGWADPDRVSLANSSDRLWFARLQASGRSALRVVGKTEYDGYFRAIIKKGEVI